MNRVTPIEIEALTNAVIDWDIVADDTRKELDEILARFRHAVAERSKAARQLEVLIGAAD